MVDENPNLSDLTSNLYPFNQFYKHRKALFQIAFWENDYNPKTDDAITYIRSYLKTNHYHFAMSGTAMTAYNARHATENEALRITLLVIPLFIIILIIFTSNYLEPLIIALTMGIAVVINMGTNAFFPNISFFSQSTVLLLQCAVTMDYAIFLLHRYREERTNFINSTEAIKSALHKSFLPILGSSLTTIAGFSAIMFMRYTIGLDMGLVMVKGILISLLIVFIFMPSIILISERWLQKTEHRTFIPNLSGLAHKSYAWRLALPIIIIILIVPSFLYQSKNEFLYGLSVVESGENSLSYQENQIINETFGQSNYVMALLPFSKDDNQINITLTKELETKSLNEIKAKMNQLGLSSQMISYYRLIDYKTYLPTIDNDSSLSQILKLIEDWYIEYGETMNELIFDYFFSEQFKKQLISSNYSRVMISINTSSESEIAFKAVDEMKKVFNQNYNQNYYLLGATPMVQETKKIVEKDYLIINLVSIIAILIILIFMFKSFLTPFLLVLVIEISIWFNMSIPNLMKNPLIFIGYLLVSSIQLGATIDYAILLTNRYIEERKTNEKKQAMINAITQSAPAILTSAVIMGIAGFTLAFSSTIEGVSSIGTLVGRGAFLSALLVLLFLPQLLFHCDLLLIKKKNKC